ncbi:hypothetical protein Leryth_012164, partial [Lithospermum erythrorhizon]
IIIRNNYKLSLYLHFAITAIQHIHSNILITKSLLQHITIQIRLSHISSNTLTASF